MSTRRRVGFNTSNSETARRQLMQPVQCWEKVWALPDNAAPGSTLKVWKWVKTDKQQQFSDDEETDQPLAPLPEPDEVEVIEGDEEMDQDEANTSVAPDTTTVSRDVSEAAPSRTDFEEQLESKPASPKPHPLSISFQPPSPTPDADVLDDALKPKPIDGAAAALEIEGEAFAGAQDMSRMGPDGELFEGAQDISQLQESDSLLGGPLVDQAMNDDPFADLPA